jgi:hypothetical protein
VALSAEVNVALLRAPFDDPVMRGFVFAADAGYLSVLRRLGPSPRAFCDRRRFDEHGRKAGR